jgi:2'-5' RNA ligase
VLRLFVAAMVPRAALALCDAELRRVEAALGPLARALRMERSEKLHFTLKFLGQAAEASVPAIAEAVARAASGSVPFDVTLEGLGAFPDTRRPRVVFLGASEGARPLLDLAAAVEREVSPLGFPSDPRGFSPHLTLARVRDPKQAPRLGAQLVRIPPLKVASFRIVEVALMQSLLGPEGSRYAQLARAPLGA